MEGQAEYDRAQFHLLSLHYKAQVGYLVLMLCSTDPDQHPKQPVALLFILELLML